MTPPLPPACAECLSMLQPPQPGAAAQQTPWKLFRSGDAKTRVDCGNTSVITNPASGKAILLDHVKKEFHEIPMPKPGLPQMGLPQFAMPQAAVPGAVPKPPAINVQDLGKGFIEGYEVEGKRYTIQPPAPPQMPDAAQAMALAKSQAMPHMPKVPGMPQMPGMPQGPQVPQAPPPPTTAEVWTSTQLKLPMLTRMAGPFGRQICQCKPAATGEPHPSLFQIPPGYKPAAQG